MHERLAFFKQHTLPVLGGVDAARAARDDERIKRLTYQLKSSCANMGMYLANMMYAALER